MHSLRADKKTDKSSSRATSPPRQAISLANADSAPLPAGFQFSSSPTTSAMYAGPPLDLLERELTKSQVSMVGCDLGLLHFGQCSCDIWLLLGRGLAALCMVASRPSNTSDRQTESELIMVGHIDGKANAMFCHPNLHHASGLVKLAQGSSGALCYHVHSCKHIDLMPQPTFSMLSHATGGVLVMMPKKCVRLAVYVVMYDNCMS